MFLPRLRLAHLVVVACLAAAPVWLVAQQPQGRGNNPFPGGTNPTARCGRRRRSRSSSRRTPTPSTRSSSPAASRSASASSEEQPRRRTELVNATRGGSEGSGIEVYDPRTGKPLKFTYQQQGTDPRTRDPRDAAASRCRRAASAAS